MFEFVIGVVVGAVAVYGYSKGWFAMIGLKP